MTGIPGAVTYGGMMKKTAGFAITTALAGSLLLLAGCTPATPAAAPSPAGTSTAPTPVSPRPTSTATAAPAPVTVPTTEAPAADPDPDPTPDPWIVTEDGVGPFRLGDDESQLIAAGFTADNSPDGYCVQLYRWDSGVARETKQQEFDATVGVQNHRITYVYTSVAGFDGNVHEDPRAPRTDTGITFGTTFDNVKATFPDIQKIVDYGGYREYVVGVNGHYLHVTTSGSIGPVEVVWGLRAATYPGEFVPGC